MTDVESPEPQDEQPDAEPTDPAPAGEEGGEAECPPEQTDNRPRPEDGEQDVSQDPEPTEGSV